jgi:SAM-dependent methyltransferase
VIERRAEPDLGLDLEPGDPHYRAYVGPPEQYDLEAGIQVGLLLAAGLREHHLFADVGCGSLRAARMLIPYLRPGHYYGIEPNRWLVDEGIARELGTDLVQLKRPTFAFVDDFSLDRFGIDFEYVLAHSVFAHTYEDLARTGLAEIRNGLADDGVLLATWVDGDAHPQGSGWVYPGVVPFPWQHVLEMLHATGLHGRRVDWMHPRQGWFAAGPDPGRVDAVAAGVRRPVIGRH